MNARKPINIDVVIASNIKRIRLCRRLGLNEVSNQIGISYQQLQKYENGKNRISASRLYELSKLYTIPIHHFYDYSISSVSDPSKSSPDIGTV